MTYDRAARLLVAAHHKGLLTLATVALLLAAAVLACDARMTSEPSAARALSTPYGEVYVIAASDEDVLAELEHAADRVAAQGYVLDVERLTIDATPGSDLCSYGGDPRAPVARVHRTIDCLDHEVLHHTAARLGRSGVCRTCQDHYHPDDPLCGGVGYDLDCNAERRAP